MALRALFVAFPASSAYARWRRRVYLCMAVYARAVYACVELWLRVVCVCVLELRMAAYARAGYACVELWLRVVCVCVCAWLGLRVCVCARALYGCVYNLYIAGMFPASEQH